MTKQLPDDWKVHRLDEIAEVVLGQSPSSKFYNESGDGLPFFQGKAEFTDLYPKVRKWCTKPLKIAEKDDVLISVRAPVGPTNFAPSECCIGRGLAAIRPLNGIPSKYILYYLRSIEHEMDSLGTGTTFRAISGKTLKSVEVPIAPPGQCERIVDEIEKQFSRLDEAVASLKHVKANLKRYKAAVLKAAVEGKLTEKWRKQNPDVEPASKLLERILTERRAKWEEAELAKMKAKGKEPKNDKWKNRYREPLCNSQASDSQLPASWVSGNVDQVIVEPMCNGLSIRGSDQPPGVKALKLNAIGGNRVDYSHVRYLPVQTSSVENITLVGDEFLVTRGNGTLAYVGRGTMVSNPPQGVIFPDTMIRLRVHRKLVEFNWLPLIWESRLLRNQIEMSAKTTAGIWKISQKDIRKYFFYLPPFDEQKKISKIVETLFSIVLEQEKCAECFLKKARNLRQALLAEAFSGRLTRELSNANK